MASDDPLLFPDDDPARYGSGRRRERLILPKLLDEEAKDMRLRGEAQDRAHRTLVKWAEMESNDRLAKMKETRLEADFLTDVFGDALGYTRFAENLPQWQLQPKFAVPEGEADAAIGFFSPDASDPPRVLIELKGPTANLDRDLSRGRTPVQQLWDYLNAVPECPWGILCNYVSFRLYHRDNTQYAYEHFTLQGLQDINVFRRFYVLFERGGFLPATKMQQPRADILLERTNTRQLEVGDDLYREYHDSRLGLIQHLRSEPHNKSVDAAIHVAQKLLDRIIFVAFCEDRELLPSNTIKDAWKKTPPFSQVTNPKWQNFKQLFRSVDEGNEKAGITEYDGDLFRQDETVDDLELDDDWTEFFHQVSTYDFRHEVDVDVLGHLLEQSITDLEALREDPDNHVERPSKKVSGRRKREGIYYTPPHITRYIVKNTIGTCLDERFAALAEETGFDQKADVGEVKPAAWIKYHSARLAVLRALRVCDPACGSGAFLIQAYDYLENIYDEVIEALRLQQPKEGDRLRDQIGETILKENLFGVDLSHEAVEITKLSLWIRTARRGKTLADLSENIHCGNSLVDDPEVDPDRHFDWAASFSHVFEQGKFDCIISNPPYVKFQNFRKRQPRIAEFLVEHYRSATIGNFDLYLPFIEAGMDLLSPSGRMGFIAPNVWLFNEYGAALRELVAERRSLERFVDFKSFQVFRDATTYTALQFFTASPCKAIQVADVSAGDLNELRFYPVSYAKRGSEAWALLDKRDQRILDTMRKASVTLAEASAQIFQGLITSADTIYHLIKLAPRRYYSNVLNDVVEIEDEIMKPLVSGEDAVPFATPPTEKYLLFPYLVATEECRLFTAKEMRSRFKHAWRYLQKNEQRLRARESRKFDDDQWWRFGRHQAIDKQEFSKLGVPQTVNRLTAFADPNGERFFNNVRVNGILERADGKYSLWFLLAILNSYAADYFFRQTAKPKDRGYFEANKQFIAPIPIPNTSGQKRLAALAQKLADLHSQRFAATARVQRRFVTDLPPAQLIPTSPLPAKLPGKLSEFHNTPVRSVMDEMEKFAKRKFKPAERENWDEYLTEAIETICSIKTKIRDAEADLNERVYKLYGLSKRQVAHIEASRGSKPV